MGEDIPQFKGRKEYRAFLKGQKLSRKEAMSAMCYICNGYHAEEEKDCRGESCPLYAWFPYRGVRGRNGPEITLRDAPEAHHKAQISHLPQKKGEQARGVPEEQQ